MNWDTIIRYVDYVVKPLIWISVIAYLIEASISENSYESPWYFLWGERCVALIFTLEYIARCMRHKGSVRNYVLSWFGLIDLVAILPFWIGFFVPTAWLSLIRTLRILRLLKFFRYSRSLQLVALGFYRAWPQVKSLTFAMMIVGLFSMAATYEAERYAQPEEFSNMFQAAWFTAVTVTTVGYGDISPVTIIGKIVCMGTFGIALTIFAGVVGVLGDSFHTILEEELDPNVDPIKKFREQYKINQKKAALDKEYSMED